VFFSSDNGTHKEGGADPRFFHSSGPLRGYKRDLYEGGIRVPLIVAGVPGAQPGAIHHSFAHVNDVLPTLLELAKVQRPGDRYQGRPIAPPTGASLLPALKGEAARVHAPHEAIGYELSGNQALFKGDLKLLKVIPPIGDGQWHLYDIRNDPGETMDLQHTMPEVFRDMQADYAAYARAHGVLPMPAGYEPTRQVLINALVNVYVPRFRGPVLALLAALAAIAVAVSLRRRKRAR
jgi:arylsulfatase/uncharacterized sulfatase